MTSVFSQRCTKVELLLVRSSLVYLRASVCHCLHVIRRLAIAISCRYPAWRLWLGVHHSVVERRVQLAPPPPFMFLRERVMAKDVTTDGTANGQ